MTEEDQASVEDMQQDGTDDVIVDEPVLNPLNFTKEKKRAQLPSLDGEDDEQEVIVGNTNDAITAPLEGLKDVEVLKGMVTRLRHENGNHRKKNNEVAEENQKLRAEKMARVKAIEEANERVTRAEAVAKNMTVLAAMREYDVEDDLFDLVASGGDADDIYERARKLANTKQRKPAYDTPTNTELFAGKRGKPLQTHKDPGGAEFLRELMG